MKNLSKNDSLKKKPKKAIMFRHFNLVFYINWWHKFPVITTGFDLWTYCMQKQLTYFL